MIPNGVHADQEHPQTMTQLQLSQPEQEEAARHLSVGSITSKMMFIY